MHRPQKTVGGLGTRVLLCQNEAKEAVANERARVHHSQEILNAKVDCTKAVLEAKYKYRMAIQEAKMIRSNQLLESEITYLKVLGKNATVRSSQYAKLHRNM